jgi:hypothetical protein
MRTHSLRLLVIVMLAGAASCSSTGTENGGGGAGGKGGTGGVVGGGGSCDTATQLACKQQVGEGCSPVAAVCVSGQWQCPAGSKTLCCEGSPGPNCTCTTAGWSCAGGQGGGSGIGGSGGGCGGTPFDCAYGSNGICGDALSAAICNGGHWACGQGQIPRSECRCAGLNPQACTCGDAGWICPDGGAGGVGGGAGHGGAGGVGGQGGAAGHGGAGGGGGGPVACSNATCAAGDVCLRYQVEGGACFPPDGGCPPGRSPAGSCCVADPTYTCMPLPAACNGTLSCDCARATLCPTTTLCSTPMAAEIDCTLLAP